MRVIIYVAYMAQLCQSVKLPVNDNNPQIDLESIMMTSNAQTESEFLGGLLGGGGDKKPGPPAVETGGTDINLVSANKFHSGS